MNGFGPLSDLLQSASFYGYRSSRGIFIPTHFICMDFVKRFCMVIFHHNAIFFRTISYRHYTLSIGRNKLSIGQNDGERDSDISSLLASYLTHQLILYNVGQFELELLRIYISANVVVLELISPQRVARLSTALTDV